MAREAGELILESRRLVLEPARYGLPRGSEDGVRGSGGVVGNGIR